MPRKDIAALKLENVQLKKQMHENQPKQTYKPKQQAIICYYYRVQGSRGRSLVATTIIDPIKPANPTNDVARKTCEDKTQLKNRIVGECSISDIATEGIPTQCLINTGCVISTISESFILNNMKDTAIKDLQDLLDDVTFESASGDPMKFNGYVIICANIMFMFVLYFQLLLINMFVFLLCLDTIVCHSIGYTFYNQLLLCSVIV